MSLNKGSDVELVTVYSSNCYFKVAYVVATVRSGRVTL